MLTRLKKTFFEDKLIIDFIFYFILLSFCFKSFYYRWGYWIDQPIYHYMAWGFKNGMILYKDLIDMNFPGIILINLLASFIYGSTQIGLRALDMIFLFVFMASSSIIFIQFKINWIIRILCMSSYFIAYISTGISQTIQRESYTVPLIILGLIPWITSFIKPEQRFSSWLWLLFGAIESIGLWIKPTPVLMTIFTILFCFICTKERRVLFKYLLFYLTGIFLVSLAFLIWLYFIGSLDGFITWCIKYNLEANQYSAVPLINKFKDTRFVIKHFFQPFCLMFLGLVLILVKSRFSAIRKNFLKEFIFVTGLFLSAFISIWIQGKTYCVYHFIPFQATLAIMAGVILSEVCSEILFRFKYLILGFITICLVFVFQQSITLFEPDSCDARLGKYFNSILPKDKTVITFGILPVFFTAFERKTPFPFIFSAAMYSFSAKNQRYKRHIKHIFTKALKEPSVSYFITPKGLRNFLYKGNFQDQKLNSLGYEKVKLNTECNSLYSIYKHKNTTN